MRFHLDEHVAHAVADALRRNGIDVTTTVDAELLDAPDEGHVEFAYREQRVIFAQDRDFLRISARGVRHAGIVFAARGTRTIGEIVSYLVLMHQCVDPGDMLGHVEFA